MFATRVPFLFDGFGHEEDSWGLVVNAYEMHTSGHYVASRFPGHPLQEYIYSFIWNQPEWIWNSFSCLFSIVAVVAFYKAMRNCGMNHAFEASLMFAFTPAFFIAGTYTIDYAWSLAFVMGSFWALTKGQYILCGIILGLAVGCRITSGVFIIPWALLLVNRLDMKQWIIDICKIGIPLFIIGVAWYIPAYMQYGTGFFDYSDQFPYPPLLKVVYKATIGVFGLIGIGTLSFIFIRWFPTRANRVTNPPALFSPRRLTTVVIIIIILHVISYLRLPQKAGYMLAIVPFIMMLAAMYSTRKTMRIAAVLFVISPFLFGMNITDELRGSGATSSAIRFTMSGQEISIDAVRGPALAEKEKRKNKMQYVADVFNQLDTMQGNVALICGWWYNEMLVHEMNRNKLVWTEGEKKLMFYATCEELTELKAGDEPYSIYFLPEQNMYNDQMFNQTCTDSIATPFSIQ